MAEVKYSKAVKRLDDIIRKIESEEIDVDELAVRVKEAVDLIQSCKDKIEKAELDVRQVVEEFSGDEDASGG